MSSSSTVFVARHGRTKLNADGRLRGHADVALDPTGAREAARLGRAFAEVPLQRIISSPLLRARETAGAIAASRGLVAEVDEGLLDRDYGPWTGAPRSDVERRFGSLDDAPGVETRAAVQARIWTTFRRLVDDDDGLLVLVGHDATNSALLAHITGQADDATIEQHTGCWNRLDRRDGVWQPTLINVVPTDRSAPISLG